MKDKLTHESSMIETHDLFLRALAVPVEKHKQKDKGKNKKREGGQAVNEPNWPEYVLAFDNEGRITIDQSLTFGVYKLCKLVGESYEAIEEGIFYADDLPAKDRRALESYMRTAISDVPCFPPRFPLYS